MAKDIAIVLNNGGMNSLVATVLAGQRYRVVMLHAEYGGPTTGRQLAYSQQATFFKPYREHTLSMPFLSVAQFTGQSAAAAMDPRFAVGLPPRMLELAPLVATASRFAMHYEAAAVYLGLRVGSQSDELARATEYVQVWNELIQLSCGQTEQEVVTPLLELDRWQVVDVAYQVGAPLELAWSCMSESDEPCGICQGCAQREAAFQQAGKPDPLRGVKKG